MVSFTLAAAVAFVASATLVQGVALNPLVEKGCYKSSQGLTFNDTWSFQSSGYCRDQCVPINKPVMGMTAAGDCWCGDTMPPLNTKSDESNCDTPCHGWPTDMCGSSDGTYFSVWNTGIKVTVLNYGETSTSSSSSSDSSTSTSSAKPSVVTVGGQTQTITAAPTAKSTAGPNKAGIAAGVVVGVIAIAALAGGAFFFMRRKQKREEEDEAKRQEAINSFMSAKPRSSGGMSSNDSRLDPIIMTRRQSDGSIMDNQDYSRRILKVTNA